MSFGISNSVRSREVRTCTPELFWKAVRSDYVATVCAGIADAWEQSKRGELAKEDYEELKNREKKRLPIFTFHATFPGGRRLNADAVPTGLSMYDIDHLEAPWEYYEQVIEDRRQELGIVLAHVTPSKEGLRLVFVIPAGLSLVEAQQWMSQQLNDPNYDRSVKDLARSSFAVPEEYILYIDEERLFSAPVSAATTPAVGHPSSPEEGNLDTPRVNQLTFKGIPYTEIIKQWFILSGGEPAQGERNTKLHRLAYHLRHITDNNEELLLKIMPRYGLSEEEMKGLIHSACTAQWCGMPKMMQEAVAQAQPSSTPPCGEKPDTARVSISSPTGGVEGLRGELRGLLLPCRKNYRR